MSGKLYVVNEVFHSIQGEGGNAGAAMVFVRFTGCNLTCRRENFAGFDCDTEFESGRHLTMGDLLAEIVQSYEDTCPPEWVLLTGGEPSLQVDRELVDELHLVGFNVAIETNGTNELPDGVDYITVSPKTAEHTLRVKHPTELRYVRRVGQAIPEPKLNARHKFLSPAFEPDGTVGQETIEWIITLIKENPEWRLSLQLHKIIGVR